MIKIRQAVPKDINIITELETICFPKEQAASKERLEERLEYFSNHFLLAEYKGVIAGYIGGMVTNVKFIKDCMYEDSKLHNEQGEYQMVFSLVVHPDYRKKQIATNLMKAMITQAGEEHRKGIGLTCLENLLVFYEKMGFLSYGISKSGHGNAIWYDMFLGL